MPLTLMLFDTFTLRARAMPREARYRARRLYADLLFDRCALRAPCRYALVILLRVASRHMSLIISLRYC